MANEKRHDVLIRIAAVQQSVESVKRTTEGYGYKYATLSDVWQLVKQSMAEHGLGWTAVCSSEIVGAESDMPTVYNTLTVAVFETEHECENLMDMVKHGEAVSSSYTYPAAAAQQVGSFETYYRRYGLIHLLGLTTVMDDDGKTAVNLPRPSLTEEFN
jgi:hypothetical protein|nr:MAG TPA: ERF superfamily protein [Caudoviricetes sp.]